MKIKRTILLKLEKALKNRKIFVLKGRRQVGKTTILKKLEQVLKNKKTAFFLFINEFQHIKEAGLFF